MTKGKIFAAIGGTVVGAAAGAFMQELLCRSFYAGAFKGTTIGTATGGTAMDATVPLGNREALCASL